MRIGRWVTKSQAVRELGISLSTLDRQIKAGEREAVRQDRRVYVLVTGPEDPNDEVLLYRARVRIDELKSVVFRLKKAALKLEMERDKALDDMIASKDQSHALLNANEERLAAYERMKRLSIGLGVVTAVLLAGAGPASAPAKWRVDIGTFWLCHPPRHRSESCWRSCSRLCYTS